MKTNLMGEKVTVTLTMNETSFIFHGQLGPGALLAVEIENRHGVNHAYMMSEAEGRRVNAEVAEWHTVSSLTGEALPLPPGSTGIWGSQAPDAAFQANTEDWLCTYDPYRIRMDSPRVRVEPLTAEGAQWVERNLSPYNRVERFRTRLEAFDPALSRELDDVLYAVRDEARFEERRASLDY